MLDYIRHVFLLRIYASWIKLMNLRLAMKSRKIFSRNVNGTKRRQISSILLPPPFLHLSQYMLTRARSRPQGSHGGHKRHGGGISQVRIIILHLSPGRGGGRPTGGGCVDDPSCILRHKVSNILLRGEQTEDSFVIAHGMMTNDRALRKKSPRGNERGPDMRARSELCQRASRYHTWMNGIAQGKESNRRERRLTLIRIVCRKIWHRFRQVAPQLSMSFWDMKV